MVCGVWCGFGDDRIQKKRQPADCPWGNADCPEDSLGICEAFSFPVKAFPICRRKSTPGMEAFLGKRKESWQMCQKQVDVPIKIT